jgi:hypothetical protein
VSTRAKIKGNVEDDPRWADCGHVEWELLYEIMKMTPDDVEAMRQRCMAADRRAACMCIKFKTVQMLARVEAP